MFIKKKKILIIDDEPDLCFFVRENLKFLGNYEVIIANDGRRGLLAARIYKPNLILLDIMMPFKDGLEVLKKLKQDKKTMSIPVIMLTAKGDEESKLEAAHLYNEDYIVKPFEIQDLKSRIDNALTRFAKFRA